jgi:hypothetical protein
MILFVIVITRRGINGFGVRGYFSRSYGKTGGIDDG